MTQSVSSRSLDALGWVILAAIGRIGGQLVVQITLARILGPEAFGKFAALMTIMALGFILSDCGFGSALIQKSVLHADDVSTALGWSMLLAVLIAAVIVALAPFIAHQFGDVSLIPMFWVSAVLVVLMTFRNISSSLLRRELKYKEPQIIDFVAYVVVFGGIATLLAIKGFGAWSLVLGFGGQMLFSLIATYSLCRHSLRLRLRGNRPLITFGLKTLGNDVTGWAMDNLDRFLIGKYWGVYSLGLYAAAGNLARAPLSLAMAAIHGITFASAARLQDDLSAVAKGYTVVLTATALATFPLFTLVAIESGAVLNLLYGAKWREAEPVMRALACGLPFVSLAVVSGAILRGLGAASMELKMQIAGALILFGGLLGLGGASLMTAVWWVSLSYLIRFALTLIGTRNALGLAWAPIATSFRGGLTLAALGGCTVVLVDWLAASSLSQYSVIPLLAGVAVVAAALLVWAPWLLGPSLTDLLHKRLTGGPMDRAASLVLKRRG